MAVDAVQIRPGQDVSGRFRIVLRHAPGQEDGFELGAMLFVGRRHGRLLLLALRLAHWGRSDKDGVLRNYLANAPSGAPAGKGSSLAGRRNADQRP